MRVYLNIGGDTIYIYISENIGSDTIYQDLL